MGVEIPGYKIERVLGSGGMAVVYLANQIALERPVAIKVTRSEISSKEAEHRFLREARILAKLHHRGIVNIYDFGTAGKLHYISMEYLPGGTLNLRKNLSTRQIVLCVRQMAEALVFAHEHNVVHRDLKPANIMFRHDGSLVITDFGIGKVLGEQTANLTRVGQALGTAKYMSPEQISAAETVDNRSDLYNIGLIFYELLVGAHPFQGDSVVEVMHKQLSVPPPQLPDRFSIYQPLLDKLLAKRREDRFVDAQEFLAALDGTEPTEPLPPTAQRKKLPRTRRSKTLLVLGGTGLLGALILVYSYSVYYSPGPKKSWLPEFVETIFKRVERAKQEEETLKVRKIKVLLAQAEGQFAAGQLTEPSDDNAHVSYLEVLDLDSENREAQRGLDDIAEEYLLQARQWSSQGKYGQSLAAIETGLQVRENDSALLAFRSQVIGAQEDERKRLRQEIDRLLTGAERQFAAGQLTEPSDDNAHLSYLEVLDLDPENREAQRGLDEIAEEYLRQARQWSRQGKYDQSLAAIETGLQVRENDSGLLAFRNQLIGAQEDEQERLTQEIDRLLTEAEGQFAAGRLTEPSDDNAHVSYLEVLDLDPENREAQRGLDEIAEEYLRQARQWSSQGKYDQSLSAIETGLQVRENDSRLLALRKQVIGAQKEPQVSEIDLLLSEAKQQIAADNLTTPPGNNAFSTFERVLEMDVGNAVAKAGMEQIAQRYAVLARAQQRRKNFDRSLVYVDRGLQKFPLHPTLTAIREQVVAEQATQEQNAREKKQITTLLARAGLQLESDQLTTPPGDNALATFRRVLALDPRNREAESGLQTIADTYLRIAGEARARNDIPGSLEALEKGLRARPSHDRLLALQRAVREVSSEGRDDKTRKPMRSPIEPAAIASAQPRSLAVLPWDLVGDAAGNGATVARGIARALRSQSQFSLEYIFDEGLAARYAARPVTASTEDVWIKGSKFVRGEPNFASIYALVEPFDIDTVMLFSIEEETEIFEPAARFTIYLIDVKRRKVIELDEQDRGNSYQDPVGFSAGRGDDMVESLARKALGRM